MIAFVLRMGQKLLERVAQGTFDKAYRLIETLIFDGVHPFRSAEALRLGDWGGSLMG
jgi:hypothetical protein